MRERERLRRAIGGEKTANDGDERSQLEKKKKLKTKKKNQKPQKPFFQSPDPAKHYGLTRVLDAPVKLANADKKDFVFQYDVKFTDGLTCGGEEQFFS